MELYQAIRMARRGAVIYSLPQPANIVAHWSADSIAQANGSTVTSWVDSVNSIVATYASSTATFQTNVMGGKPSLRFPGTSNGYLTIPTPGALATAIGSQTFTVMITFQQLSNTSGTYGTLLSYNATVPNAQTAYYLADQSRLHRYPFKASSASSPFTALNSFTTFGNTSGPGPLNSALERIYINGGCVASETAKAPGGTPSAFYVGSAAAGFPVNADIFEIVVWNTELTPAQVKQYHAWAAQKYSQTTPWSSLPKYYTVFDGDSITAGAGIVSTQADIYPYKCAAALGLSYGQWDNLGIGFQTMSQMTAKFATDVFPIGAQTGLQLKVAAWEWYNQKGASPTPENASVAYLNATRSSTVKVCFGTSTDWTGTDNDRPVYDTYFDSNHANTDAYVPIHNNSFIGVVGAAAANPSNFQSDGLHLAAAGTTILAPLMTSGLNAIT